jgi:hypothetical protein
MRTLLGLIMLASLCGPVSAAECICNHMPCSCASYPMCAKRFCPILIDPLQLLDRQLLAP